MTNKLILIFVIILLVISVGLIVRQWQTRKRIKEMESILEKVLDGNNKLYLFTMPGTETANLSLQINQLMESYQKERILVNREQQARKQLLANLSHDVRTPLASVIGYLEAVIGELVHGNERELYLQTALQKSYDLKRRIDQLFELVRLDANEIQLKEKKLDICELVRGVVIEFVPLLEKGHFDVETQIPHEEYLVKVDPSAFIRVIQNLIRNVLIHGKSGCYLGIHVYAENEYVCVDVVDHGNGIAAQDMEFIFDRLYQGDSARTEHGGLGLAIAYELMKKMGGNINVNSLPSSQTVFKLQLPLAR
ncbi:Sensor histidine kinase YycG [compost metagenome]